MPIVKIYCGEDMDIDKKREMVKKVSEAVAEANDLPVTAMSVLVQGLPIENVAYGGKLVSDFDEDKLTAMQNIKSQ